MTAPNYLQALPRWGLWRETVKGGKKTKVPYAYRNGKPASVTVAEDWTTYQNVQKALKAAPGAWDGPGIRLGDVVGTDEYLAGIDLDTCLDDGALAEWAKPYLRTIQTYAEISPSGTGLKLFFRFKTVDLPDIRHSLGIADDEWGRKKTYGTSANGGHPPAAEIYLSVRYFTVTEQPWLEAPDEVAIISRHAFAALGALYGSREQSQRSESHDTTPPEEAALRRKLAAAMKNQRFADRWLGGTDGLADTSRSGIAMSLGGMMKHRGFSYAEMRAALIANGLGAAKEHADDDDERYFERIWSRTKAEEQPPPPKTDEAPAHSNRPTVRVLSGLRHLAADRGIEAMAIAGVPFYQRDKVLVRASIARAKTSDGAVVEVPSIVPVSLPILARTLGQIAEWEKVNAKGEPIRIDPPKEVVEQIAAMFGYWPFPPMSGVIATQTMRPDGSLLLTAGYDEATGLVLMAPPTLPPMPLNPTKTDAWEALALLKGLLREFPFADDASRSTAVSMLLTPVLRGALAPAVPMHMVAAPQAGTGKSYLQDIASVLATGERCAVINIAPEPSETEKRLIGAALAGYPIIALDNCNGVLTGDFLAQVTERPLLQLRALGSSVVIRVTNVFSVFANGNNISVSADLVRRTVMCSLDANMENPESRSFTGNPLATVMAERGRYVAACLTIGRAYVCAGMPGRLPPTPSFERWSDLVRSALVWLGWVDPMAGVEAIRADDPVRSARAAVFEAWAGVLQIGIGYHTDEVIKAAELFNERGDLVNPALRSALFDVARSKSTDRIDAQRLGHWLRATTKIVSGKYKLLVDRSNPTRQRWSLHELQR